MIQYVISSKLIISYSFFEPDRPSPTGEDGVIEGILTRKHEWESTTKKASNRSWDKVSVTLFEKPNSEML